MKKLQLCLALLAIATSINAQTQTWDCGANVVAAIPTSQVKATIEFVGVDSILRIYGTGEMFDFTRFGYPDSTSVPWFDISKNITKVVIENGVTTVGNYAFYSCDNLKEIHLPQTIIEVGDGWVSYDDFGDTIYCGAPIPPKGPDVSSSYLHIFTNAFVKVPDDLVIAYCSTDNITNKQGDVYFNWWSHFHANVPSHIIGSNDAAAVCSTPQDSIKSNQFTINLELIGKDEADRRTYKYEITATGGSDNHHFWVIYDEEQDKWRVSEDGVKAPMRRKPILLHDTVRRTTETIQIDITNLTPATNYNYSVTGYNNTDDVIFQAQGSIMTSPSPYTSVDHRTYEATTPKRYNLLGQPVDENYNGIIITEKGEKRLQK